ncbi:AAA family ATPase [Heliobacterium mobile]|nr:AAA family ATPase [Heliobacterium mobile]
MLENYIKSGYPAVAVLSPEEKRVLSECQRIARRFSMNVAAWTTTNHLHYLHIDKSASAGMGMVEKARLKATDPVEALNKSAQLLPNTIYCLLDFHPYWRSPDVWRTAKDMFQVQKRRGIVFVFISSVMDIPVELEREIAITTIPFPGREEMEPVIRKVSQAAQVEIPEDITAVADAALGLTLSEAENAFSLSLAMMKSFDPAIIMKEKEQIIHKSGVLEIVNAGLDMSSVGGLAVLKQWLRTRVSAFSPEAQAYGLPFPRGVLLVGVPGCGKSLSAKALASEWQKPLLRLDAGRLFSSFVGETEANTRNALAVAEAVSPAVLWIDEIEKGLAGVQSSNRTDSGVTARVFGHFLTWMQEKKSPVFVVATANDVSQLPPEFLRKGRFDEIFFVDLPDAEERMQIFEAQLRRRRRDPQSFNLEVLSQAAEGFSGAEIEEAVIMGMFHAWSDDKREVNTEDILQAARLIIPMCRSEITRQRIEALREWGHRAARLANGTGSRK